MPRPGPRRHPVSRPAGADDERGYGPNPRSQPFRERHSRRAGSGAAWPPAEAAARFFEHDVGEGDYAYRYYGRNAESGAMRAGRAYGVPLGEDDELGRFQERGWFANRPEDPQGAPPPRRAGPRGYVRSDERIREQICERLADRADIDAADVSVAVNDGRVTLEGSVPHRQMKHRIDALCDDSPGVRGVDNRIRVARPPADAPRWY